MTFSFELRGAKKHSDPTSTSLKTLRYGLDMSTDKGATWTSLVAPAEGAMPSAKGKGTFNAVVPSSAVGKTAVFRIVACDCTIGAIRG